MDRELYNNYVNILKEELIPAMGCTEPIAIAYAAARAARTLGEEFTGLEILCSGNMIKNVKGVTVPNSGGMKGIEAAAILGAVGGDPDRELEVISGVTDEDRKKTAELVKKKVCSVSLAENVPNLYVNCKIYSKHHSAEVTLTENHTNISYIRKDDRVLLDKREPDSENTADQGPDRSHGDRSKMSLKTIIEFADEVDLDDIRELLEQQIRYNSAIAQEGIDNRWGAGVGKLVLENFGSSPRSRACALAAAGSDARMSGCPLPVVINSGSGNQGITVTMPVLVFAEEWSISHDKCLRSLALGNLVSVYIKHYIGALSAFCGAVSAAAGAGAAITYMGGYDYQHIGSTITNTLANVGGIVCDGAKPSCAAKIESSVNAAILAHYMSVSDREFKGGEGIVEDDVEDTIRNVGYIGKIGMKTTDREILNVMIDKVDVNSCL